MSNDYDKRRRENPGDKRLTQDELRSIRNARKCLGLKIGKYASFAAAVFTGALAIGSQSLMDAVVYGVCILLFLAVAVVLHNVIRTRQTKWGKYEALINWQGNTSLEYISQNTGYPMNKVINDLQDMIDKKFLIGPTEELGAYIDKNNELLVMTDIRTGKPLEPLEEAIKRRKTQAKIKSESESIKAIRQAVLEVKDDEVRDILFELSGSIGKIEKKLKDKPELAKMDNVRRFNETYLPRTIELIDKYRSGDASPETMEKIKETLKICAEAFENIEENIYERESEDTLADIEVIKAMLAREGFLDSDFDITK